MTTVALGDDHVLFLEALVPLLERRGITVVGVANTLLDLRRLVQEKNPDLCLLDRHFDADQETNGVAEILGANPRTKVIMLTADPSGDTVFDALQSGAVGYVHKTRGLEHLIAAIDRVAAGEVLIDVPSRWQETPRRAHGSETRRLAEHLTGRERQCLALLVEGQGTDVMAKRLSVSTATVRSHVQAVLTKLGVHSRLEAASLAVRHALVDPVADAIPVAPATPRLPKVGVRTA
jgi:two-component system nitrate/nitrite response regulator NarL